MKIVLNQIIALLLNFNRLAARLDNILDQARPRTIKVFYENRTSFVSQEVTKSINHIQLDRAYHALVVYNIDDKHIRFHADPIHGAKFLTISILEDIKNHDQFRRLHQHSAFNPRFNHLYLGMGNFAAPDISGFFRNIWRYSVLNAALFIWTDGLRIYTHMPYQKRFGIKEFDESEPGQTRTASELFNSLFCHKSDDLGNSTFNVFVLEDPLKFFPTPGRFRIGSKYYFNGRDGNVARALERSLNAHWQYRTVPSTFKLVDFKMHNGPSPPARDLLGNIVPPDDAQPSNVDFIHLSKNFSTK